MMSWSKNSLWSKGLKKILGSVILAVYLHRLKGNRNPPVEIIMYNATQCLELTMSI